jgi:hypothetical protein
MATNDINSLFQSTLGRNAIKDTGLRPVTYGWCCNPFQKQELDHG